MLGRLNDTHLEKLSNLNAVSGDEGAVRKYIREQITPLCDEVWVDTMGNLYGRKRKEGKPVVMVCAHMDEVGLLITKIRDDGELEYAPCGIDPRVMPGRRVSIGREGVMGVIGSKAIHLQSRDEFQKSYKHSQLTIDIGAKDKADAEKYVHVGDYACFITEFSLLGDGLMVGKALDDRIGCAAIIELLKQDYDCDFYAVFTVQEEVGTRGAMAAVYNVKPDVCLVMEGTTANDMPDVKGHQRVTRVGKGPAISFMDRGTIVRPKMFDALRNAAKEAGIPFQLRQGANGGTDAGAIHKAVGGCYAGGISVPCRYIHSAVSVASVSDFENALDLAHAFLSTEKFLEVLNHDK